MLREKSKSVLLIIVFFLSVTFLSAEGRVRIGLFYDWQVKSLLVRVEEGGWELSAGGEAFLRMKPGEIVFIAWLEDLVYVRSPDLSAAVFREITFTSPDSGALVGLQPVVPALEKRLYRGELSVRPGVTALDMILLAGLEDYLAGVVQAEGGYRADPEFYKAQAVLCRTYALRHMEKHAGEGFDLCDAVHCQAFKGMIHPEDPIARATFATKGLVVTGRDGMLVTAAYHSNCGGETQAAGNVWLESLPYLVSVSDPFCLHARNARWTITIPLNEWRSYLEGAGVPPGLMDDPSVFVFDQPDRKKYYTLGSHRLELRKIREDWNLRSTFFDTRVNGGNLVIQGKGNGHGVGMCQEGAMKMAAQGYSFGQIIRYYFNQVSVAEFEPRMVPDPEKH